MDNINTDERQLTISATDFKLRDNLLQKEEYDGWKYTGTKLGIRVFNKGNYRIGVTAGGTLVTYDNQVKISDSAAAAAIK